MGTPNDITMAFRRLPLLITLCFFAGRACAQQDMDFHFDHLLFQGQNILKVKRDFYDPYLWVLAQNNHVYRVNSLTMVFDDYTSTFAAYNNVNFVDIAGRSADTVYVATNATRVIEYEKGVLRTIDKPSGIDGTVNSIGLDYHDHIFAGNPTLVIGTTTGLYYYDCRNEYGSLQTSSSGPNQAFEATYRTLATSDIGKTYYDPNTQFPLILRLPYMTDYGAVQYNTPEFGNTVNTVYYLTNGFSLWNTDYLDVLYMTQVWGTEKGLFQNQWSNSNHPWVTTAGYLPGIRVNKVTSIFGLLAYSSPASQAANKMERENLLVGTQNGFYFTNSVLHNFTGPLHDFNTFTLDADVGNQPVNDVCVNATSYATTLCENGVWVASANGLYYLKPDYKGYVNPLNYSAISFSGQPPTLSAINICQGQSVVAEVNGGVYSGDIIQWYKDGQQLTGEAKDKLTINATGDYDAILYDPCSDLHVTTNHLKVKVINAAVFDFAYPDEIPQCDNTPITLQVTDNPGYTYRWYTNGALNGGITSSYQVTQSGKYKVEVSACNNNWVPSKEVQVDMINLPVPQIMADKTQYCAEDVARLTVNTPTDPSYTINWYHDGTLMTPYANLTTITTNTGGNYTATINSNVGNCSQTSTVLPVSFTPAPVFTFNYPSQIQYCAGTPVTLTASGSAAYQYQWYQDGTALTNNTGASFSPTQAGKYKVEVSSCPGSWVSSTELQLNFVAITQPTISADKPAYCQGDDATLSIDIQPDPLYTINWYQNGSLINGAANQTLLSATAGGNYTVSVSANTANTDGSTCSATSAVQAITFSPQPTISIQQTAVNGFCQGQTVTLTAQHSDGTVLWSDGETGDQIQVTQSGTYTATITSPAGCVNSIAQPVTIFPVPDFTLSDVTVCSYDRQPITLTAPAGYKTYNWDNGASDQPTYQVSRAGTVTLTITDANGCQATRTATVTEKCPDVHIPNTFTPNGDGVNDVWNIEGLDESASVKVFTRWGMPIFQSLGYTSPWKGEYNGKRLQPGVYYYIVTVRNGAEKFSGALTIIY